MVANGRKREKSPFLTRKEPSFWTGFKTLFSQKGRQACHTPLYHVTEVPKYLQDNLFIQSGYRAHYNYVQSWCSLFRWHNETGNVWTHLIPGFILLSHAIYLLWQELTSDTVSDGLVVFFFLAAACVTLFSSSLFHLHYCAGEKAYRFWGCIDFSGISVLICTSAASLTYFVFYCRPRLFYGWIGILVLCNLTGVLGPFLSQWYNPRFRILRTVAYIASGCMSFGPLIHFLMLGGNDSLPHWSHPSVRGCLMSFGSYLGGALIYCKRFPEKWFPGKFDYLCHSHQLWHLLVVLGACSHLEALKASMAWRLNQGSCALYYE